MAYELKDDEGNLFKNKKKEPDDRRPDYTGTIRLAGVERQIAGWIQKGVNGKPSFMSLRVSDRKERGDA